MGRGPLLVVLATAALSSLAAACGGGGDAVGGTTATTLTSGPTVADLDDLAPPGARAAFVDGEVPAGTAVARLEIAPAAVDVVARSGASDGSAVGHVPGSALPCGQGLAVFVGGTRSSFATLEAAAVGDAVEVLTPVSACTYEVHQSAVVAAADLDLAGGGDRRPGSIVLAAPVPGEEDDDLRHVVVAELDEDSVVLVGESAEPGVTTTTTEPVVVVGRPSGREAVDALLEAWRAGDRTGALSVAAPAAVDALFALPVESAQGRGCTQGDANVTVTCVFRLPSGELQVRATPAGDTFVVDFLILSPH